MVNVVLPPCHSRYCRDSAVAVVLQRWSSCFNGDHFLQRGYRSRSCFSSSDVPPLHYRFDQHRGLSLPHRSIRPLRRCLVAEQFYGLTTAVCIATPTDTEVSRHRTKRPIPRCLVTKQGYRRITTVLHYLSDQPQGVSLPNKVNP